MVDLFIPFNDQNVVALDEKTIAALIKSLKELYRSAASGQNRDYGYIDKVGFEISQNVFMKFGLFKSSSTDVFMASNDSLDVMLAKVAALRKTINELNLQYAVENNDLNEVKNLAEKLNKINSSLIINTAIQKRLEILKYLIEKSDEFNSIEVFKAFERGVLNVVNYLIEQGASTDHRTIAYAMQAGDYELVKYLVEHGGKISEWALGSAIQSGNSELVKYLISQGAMVDEWSISGGLLLAIKNKDQELISHFLNNIKEVSEKFIFEIINDKEALELLKDKGALVDLNKVFYSSFIKGNYEFANKLYNLIDIELSGSITEDVTNALMQAIDNSIENNKLHALTNLVNKSGLDIPKPYHHLINNIHDDIDPKNFSFLYGIIHKLAKHYINLSKRQLEDNLSAEDLDNLEVNVLLNEAFKDKSSNRLESFEKLIELLPDNVELKKITNEFDVHYAVVGNALNKLDQDFSLEVLALNGVEVPMLEEDTTVYRGYVANMTEDDISGLFKFGTRSFAVKNMQKFLGFHVREYWNKIDFHGHHFWQYGGTYTSLEPHMSAQFANGLVANRAGDNIFLEINLKQGTPKVYGNWSNEYELIRSNITANEIVAAYKLDDYKVSSVFTNPYLEDKQPQARYAVGEEIVRDEEAIATYKSLKCNINYYQNYKDFINKYTYKEEMLEPYFKGRELYQDDIIEIMLGMNKADCDLSLHCC